MDRLVNELLFKIHSCALMRIFPFSFSFGEVSAVNGGGRQEAGEGQLHDMRQPENSLGRGFSGFCGCDNEESVTIGKKAV